MFFSKNNTHLSPSKANMPKVKHLTSFLAIRIGRGFMPGLVPQPQKPSLLPCAFIY